MLVKTTNGKIAHTVSISDKSLGSQFLVDNPEYFETDFQFVEDIDLYEYDGSTFTLKSGWEAIKAERQATINATKKDIRKKQVAKKAKEYQEKVLEKLSKNEQKKTLGLPPDMTDENESTLKGYAIQIQADIDYPSESQAYNPPLPPGVTPPAISSIIITVTRQEGWQGNIGWRAVITAGEENFIPANLAIAEYTNPDCDGYLYTTGAFQEQDGEYFAECPAGQEKGDVDLNLGLLYGAAPLSCFTFKAGNQEQIVYAYEEV